MSSPISPSQAATPPSVVPSPEPDLPRLGVSPLTHPQVPAAVRLHRTLLPHGFFVELGPSFLGRYYSQFIDSPHAYNGAVAVATQDMDDRPVAVLVGTLNHAAHAQWSNKSLGGLALAAGTAMLRHPSLLVRFLRTRLRRYCGALARRLRRAVRPNQSPPGQGTRTLAVLSHVYVDPDHQGEGYGRMLVEDFLTAARDSGADQARLVTLAGPDGAGAFYAAGGWQPSGAPHLVDGQLFQTYIFEL